MPLPAFETERLIVRQIQASDAEGLHQAYGNSEAMRFWDFPATHSVADTGSRIKGALRSKITYGVWAILRRDGGGFVGMINYHHREANNRRLELGWIIVPACWRQGLMTEAARPVLNFCFKGLRSHRVEALIEPENVASRALATRLGFVQEGGLLRDRMCVEGTFRSLLMYGLLEGDWAQVRAAASNGHG
jgi:[ribosomal protein S5]-alanine N-acetyltransferase